MSTEWKMYICYSFGWLSVSEGGFFISLLGMAWSAAGIYYGLQRIKELKKESRNDH
ncbi:hypothetical protein [Rhizobacter sp. OV335]|jgi:hypothetical protein|uniref:hypothetical protein n=1 Tax=Rhizobacter sp. OV335 TaxID=1500264 RepID=UPI00091E8909|nr:hypothetical protein [Rhizobacter sp. OV335]SHN40396.1 hypothetical protein SAMN02787076_06237 [Rhizobacter sp. OV335]